MVKVGYYMFIYLGVVAASYSSGRLLKQRGLKDPENRVVGLLNTPTPGYSFLGSPQGPNSLFLTIILGAPSQILLYSVSRDLWRSLEDATAGTPQSRRDYYILQCIRTIEHRVAVGAVAMETAKA